MLLESGVASVKEKNVRKKKTAMENGFIIQRRITRGFFTATALTGIAALIGCIVLIVLAVNYGNILTYYGFAQGDMGKTMVAFADTRSAMRAAIGYSEETAIANAKAEHESKVASTKEYMAITKESLKSPEELECFSRIEATLEEYWVLEQEIIAEGATVHMAASMQAQSKVVEKLDPLYNEIYSAMTELMAMKVNGGDAKHSVIRMVATVFAAISFLLIVFSVMKSYKMGASIAHEIAAPLEKLSERFKGFAQGDLSTPFPETDNQDEVAVMIEDAAAMAENLNLIIGDAGRMLGEMAKGNYDVHAEMEERYVGDFQKLMSAMRQMNRQVSAALVHIEDASDQVSVGADNLANGAQALAEGATEQAGAVEELQATITSITEGVLQAAQYTANSYKEAEQYAQEADNSRIEMKEMMAAMERINETSKKIENIISEIEDIASQTNLLSLNAAIEAARAGEAGRGFAVVADQIRNLAEQSARSAVDTRDLIGGALREIEEGNKTVDRAAASIEGVVQGMKHLAETSRELSSQARQQAEAMKQVEQGIEQISEVVQSNSATAQESSATSEELSAQAISLKELVGQFTLRRDV